MKNDLSIAGKTATEILSLYDQFLERHDAHLNTNNKKKFCVRGWQKVLCVLMSNDCQLVSASEIASQTGLSSRHVRRIANQFSEIQDFVEKKFDEKAHCNRYVYPCSKKRDVNHMKMNENLCEDLKNRIPHYLRPSSTQYAILLFVHQRIKDRAKVTISSMASHLGLTASAINYNLKILRRALIHAPSRRYGRWVITSLGRRILSVA